MCRRPLLLYNKPMSHPCEAFPLSVYRITFIIRSPLRIAQEPLLKVRTGGFQYFDAKGAPVPGNETAALVEKTTTARWDGMRWVRPYQITRNTAFPALGKIILNCVPAFQWIICNWRLEGNRNRCSVSMCGRLPCCYYVWSLEGSVWNTQCMRENCCSIFFGSGFWYFVHCSMIKLVISSTSFLQSANLLSLKCHPFLFTGEMDWTLF